jgi:putative FmdB family regulatory protein
LPTYQYRCTECDHAFEEFQSFTDDALTVCPVCGGRLRKVFNAVGVVFKGSGFYRTDSRSTDGSSSSSSDGSGSKDSKESSTKAADTSSSSGTSESGSTSSSSSGSSSSSSSGSSSSSSTTAGSAAGS